MAEEFLNPKRLIQRETEKQRLRSSFPEKHPKISTQFDDIPYNHSESVLGISLGMTENESIILADKFQKAESQAKTEGDKGLVSRTMAILMPTLTSKEIVFAVSYLLCKKLDEHR